MAIIFKLSKAIEQQIEEFLKMVHESSRIFEDAIGDYLDEREREFEKRIGLVTKNEKVADQLREEIEKQLYLKTLIPENRGDVLAILENTDNVIDSMKSTLLFFSVEKPEIPNEFDPLFKRLTAASVKSVDYLIKAISCFFKDLKAVNALIVKVSLYEEEADEAAIILKREIFTKDIELSRKMHLRYFANSIEQISDYAETVSDRLAIYTIKRLV